MSNRFTGLNPEQILDLFKDSDANNPDEQVDIFYELFNEYVLTLHELDALKADYKNTKYLLNLYTSGKPVWIDR